MVPLLDRHKHPAPPPSPPSTPQQVCKEQYGRKTSLALWVLIELAIIGCDLQEIVGSAIAFQILFGFPLWLGCLITFVDTLTYVRAQRKRRKDTTAPPLLSALVEGGGG